LLEQQVDFARREHGGGFIEDQYAAIADQVARDLHHLLMADTEFAHERVRVDSIESNLGHRLTCVFAQRRAVDPAEATFGQTIQKEVFSNRQRGQQVQFLHHHAHTERFSVAAACRRVRDATKLHGARGGRDKTAYDLRERALAGAVFACQREYFAGTKMKRDVREHRFDVGLADPVNGQHRRYVGGRNDWTGHRL
jgi:hypothetical protein